MGGRMLVRILLMAVVLAGPVVRSQPSGARQPVVTTIYIVRHAERQDSSADSPLSAVGLARAERLAHVLKDEQISAVFVSEYQRTRQTGEPLAAANGLAPISYVGKAPEGAVSQVLEKHPGGRILFVGHSNTVDDLAAGFGVAGVKELEDSQHDRMFVIHRVGDVVRLQRLRYGVETP